MKQRDDMRLRELGPGEVDVLQTVFDGLSTTSRYLRFHGPMPTLTRMARDRLAAVDGQAHVAFAAFAGDRPVGIARLVGVGDGVAELAVEVVDAWHRRGVGTRLVRAVVSKGRAVGYRQIAADVLVENRAVQALFLRVFDSVRTVVDGWEMQLVADLTEQNTCAA